MSDCFHSGRPNGVCNGGVADTHAPTQLHCQAATEARVLTCSPQSPIKNPRPLFSLFTTMLYFALILSLLFTVRT